MTTSFEHTPGPWDIEWFVCRMGAEDVLHARAGGNETAKIGDEMWRVPLKIGPLSVDHCHWAGTHLDCPEKDARLIAAAPDLLEALRLISGSVPSESALDYCKGVARAAITKATGGQT